MVRAVPLEQLIGAGVVVVETGRVYGGDANYFYVGTFDVTSGVAQTEIDVG